MLHGPEQHACHDEVSFTEPFAQRLYHPVGALLAFATLATACGAPRAAVPPRVATDAGLPPFGRVIAPFDVSDETGTPYTHPFLGGLNLPRPQFIDIDNDGDLDLFLQEYSNDVMFFEQVGSPPAGRFSWRTDRYQDLEVGEWFRFVDMDDDGDFDLLAEERFSHIRYYRNDGTPSDPSFTLAADTLRDVDGKPLSSDRQNIPNVTDLDCDGDMDLFIGQLVGTVTRYEEVPTERGGAPRFRLVTDRFEDIEIIAQIGSLHGANTLALADIDGDGDKDFFWGDFFESGLLFIENTGSCTRPALRSQPVPFPLRNPLSTSGYNAPAFGDVDNDGDLDFAVGVIGGVFDPNRTAADNLYFFEQISNGSFALRTQRLIDGIDLGSESIPVLTDLDGDGDLDLLVANKIDPNDLQTSRIYHFENQGNRSEPSFRLTGTMALRGSYHYAPALADLDGDGDLDMVLGSWGKHVAYYRNDGSRTEPRFVLGDSTIVTLTRGSNATPALVDIDADGDLDLFVGEASGTLNFYRNVGSAEAADFILESDHFGDIDVGRRSFPAFVDLDRDGDLDLVIGTDAGPLTFFRNQGTPRDADFVADSAFALVLPSLSAPAFADIDDDGDLDLVAGGIGGGLLYYENRRISQ